MIVNRTILVWLLALVPATAFCQDKGLTLDRAVQQALAQYPALRVSTERASAAAAAIQLARTSYLPRADALAQINRATHNNVFGLLLPQTNLPVLSSLSGPVLGTNSLESVWGTAVGGLVSWEPFDFGLREANVELAKSNQAMAEAQVSVTRLQVAAAAADAFLTILAAQQTVSAAEASVERAKVLSQSVEALVKNELRPGADASRARAELALAQTQLIRAEEAVDLGKAALGQLLGVPGPSLRLDAGTLLQAPRETEPSWISPARHPAAVAQNAAVEQVRKRERILERSYYPRFNLQATSFGRGTGVQPTGVTGGAASGLAPNIQNWAVGMTVTFPVFELFSIRARKEIERYNERTEIAKYDQVVQELNGQQEQARASLDGALRVARNTPVQISAAQATLEQATARYKSGLTALIDVADAQRLLAQVEIDDAVAKLKIWRARLALEMAQGDIEPFLRLTSR